MYVFQTFLSCKCKTLLGAIDFRSWAKKKNENHRAKAFRIVFV